MAKTLRKRPTDAERLLWPFLKRKRIEGLKFRRQEPIGRYIVDFVCYERGIVIEAVRDNKRKLFISPSP